MTTPALDNAAAALLEERGLLTPGELASQAAMPPECLTALAGLAHRVRLVL